VDWKTWLKQRIEKYTGVRLYRWSLPRGVDFAYDARHILVPEKVQVVFDVGANIGQSADRYRLTYPNARILCFEPVSTTFQELNRRVATWRQVETYHLAFGSTAGPKSIHINSDPISSVNSFVNAFDGDLKEVVQVQTLDEFCLKNSIDNVDLLKIDVEGFEYEIITAFDKFLPKTIFSFEWAEEMQEKIKLSINHAYNLGYKSFAYTDGDEVLFDYEINWIGYEELINEIETFIPERKFRWGMIYFKK